MQDRDEIAHSIDADLRRTEVWRVLTEDAPADHQELLAGIVDDYVASADPMQVGLASMQRLAGHRMGEWRGGANRHLRRLKSVCNPTKPRR